MTDYSGWTDEQVNEAIAVKRGWVLHSCVGCNHDWWMMPDGGVDYNQTDPPYYTHDWKLAGELLEEFERGGIAKVKSLTLGWLWMAYTGTEEKPISCTALTPQRAICEAWLAWKEKG